MTVFIWISFFWTHSILLVYVIFNLERSSSEAPSSFGKSLVFSFNFTSFLCDGLCLEELVFWALLILHAFVMFRSGRGCYEALPSSGWTLVLRPVNGRLRSESFIGQLFSLCGGLCSIELSFFLSHLIFIDFWMFRLGKGCFETPVRSAWSLVPGSVSE